MLRKKVQESITYAVLTFLYKLLLTAMNYIFTDNVCHYTHETIARWTEHKMIVGLRLREMFQHFSTQQIQFD